MPGSFIAAVRGAISVPSNEALAIRDATARLLRALIERNRLTPDRIVSAIFTATPDLNADFPAHAARTLGWTGVPLLGAVEMSVPGAPQRIVRVLLTVSGVARGARLVPVYLDQAALLRPDLATAPKAARGPARRVAIIGLGQIGGSLGLALGAAGGWQRVGFDVSARTRRAAVTTGVVDEVASSLAAACAGAALAVIAVPVDALPGVIARVAAALPEGATLLDTGSARAGATEALEQASRHVHAVGGHPLAGSEGRGLAAASAQLFRGAPFLLLPLRGGVPAIVRRLVRDLGARATLVSPRRHDAALARTSHLPYLIACALARLGRASARAGLSGPGFTSMTRLAASDPRMAQGYVRANATNVRSAWRALRRDIDRDLERLGRAAPGAQARSAAVGASRMRRTSRSRSGLR